MPPLPMPDLSSAKAIQQMQQLLAMQNSQQQNATPQDPEALSDLYLMITPQGLKNEKSLWNVANSYGFSNNINKQPKQ